MLLKFIRAVTLLLGQILTDVAMIDTKNVRYGQVGAPAGQQDELVKLLLAERGPVQQRQADVVALGEAPDGLDAVEGRALRGLRERDEAVAYLGLRRDVGGMHVVQQERLLMEARANLLLHQLHESVELDDVGCGAEHVYGLLEGAAYGAEHRDGVARIGHGMVVGVALLRPRLLLDHLRVESGLIHVHQRLFVDYQVADDPCENLAVLLDYSSLLGVRGKRLLRRQVPDVVGLVEAAERVGRPDGHVEQLLDQHQALLVRVGSPDADNFGE